MIFIDEVSDCLGEGFIVSESSLNINVNGWTVYLVVNDLNDVYQKLVIVESFVRQVDVGVIFNCHRP